MSKESTEVQSNNFLKLPFDHWFKYRQGKSEFPKTTPVDADNWSDDGKKFYQHVCESIRALATLDRSPGHAIDYVLISRALTEIAYIYDEDSGSAGEYAGESRKNLMRAKSFLVNEEKGIKKARKAAMKALK